MCFYIPKCAFIKILFNDGFPYVLNPVFLRSYFGLIAGLNVPSAPFFPGAQLTPVISRDILCRDKRITIWMY